MVISLYLHRPFSQWFLNVKIDEIGNQEFNGFWFLESLKCMQIKCFLWYTQIEGNPALSNVYLPFSAYGTILQLDRR